MECEHAQRTTLLWLYGEAGDEHLVHIQGCATCQAVVADHADVAASLGSSVAAVARRAESRAVSRPWPRAWAGPALAMAVAAVSAALILGVPRPRQPLQVPLDPDVSAAMAASSSALLAPPDSLEDRLDDLDLDLDGLSHDLEIL